MFRVEWRKDRSDIWASYMNTTGAYELDLSLANDFSKAWRVMHVQTDVFCSAAIILPDKAGRQINVGGSLCGMVKLYITHSSQDGLWTVHMAFVSIHLTVFRA